MLNEAENGSGALPPHTHWTLFLPVLPFLVTDFPGECTALAALSQHFPSTESTWSKHMCTPKDTIRYFYLAIRVKVPVHVCLQWIININSSNCQELDTYLDLLNRDVVPGKRCSFRGSHVIDWSDQCIGEKSSKKNSKFFTLLINNLILLQLLLLLWVSVLGFHRLSKTIILKLNKSTFTK